jgi:hypothetical protein
MCAAQVRSGTWWPADRAASGYRYLPVEVPAGHRALHVELGYDRGAGVLDLGCFDPAGAFRGWSGGARDAFTVAEDWATPGYLAGPLAEGTWHVALGLHRVSPDGLPWRLTATTAGTPPPAPPVPEAAPWPRRPVRPGPVPPAPPGYRWLAGDLHAHTVHSDGLLTVPELARLAVARGLDLLAVTDHNTDSHHPLLAQENGILLLPGQELTTGRGHANALGDIGWVDFRAPAEAWLSTVEDRGGLLSVNHPLGADLAWLHPLAGRPHLAEVWHSGWWDRTWTAPLAWLLAFGPRIVPVGGSDFHDPAQPYPPGAPTTWVLCPVRNPRDADVPMVLDALRAGRVAVSDSPGGPLLLPLGGDLVALGADGALVTGLDGRREVVRGELASVPARPGVRWLEDHRGTVLAIAAQPAD